MRHSVIAAITFALCMSAPVQAHDHKDDDGSVIAWYDPDCCNMKDCAPVVTITPVPGGLLMTRKDGLSSVVEPHDVRRPSKDMRWHICINSAKKRICVYEPPST